MPRTPHPAIQHMLVPTSDASARVEAHAGQSFAARVVCVCIFPRFIRNFRAIVSLLKDGQARDHLCRKLRQAGRVAIAEMVKSLSLTDIISWRWHSLRRDLCALEHVLPALASAIDWDWFSASGDPTRIGHARDALDNASFFAEYVFVMFITTWIDDLFLWIGRCRCGCAEGVQCFYRGRLLKWAYTHAVNAFNEGLAVAEEWVVNFFDGYVYVWQQGLAATRMVFNAGLQAVSYLDKLPWLLARLDMQGVARRCIELYNATPLHLHHELAVELLQEGHPSGYRELVDQIDEDGNGLLPRLRRMVDGLQNVPLDDIAAESPHAIAKRVIAKASSGGFPWAASSCRLSPNLEMVGSLASSTGGDIQTEWDRWSSVVKFKNTHRRAKLPPAEVT